MADIKPGLALECFECGTITPDPEAEEFAACPECGSDATDIINLSACPEPSGDCDSDDHHFGLGMHASKP